MQRRSVFPYLFCPLAPFLLVAAVAGCGDRTSLGSATRGGGGDAGVAEGGAGGQGGGGDGARDAAGKDAPLDGFIFPVDTRPAPDALPPRDGLLLDMRPPIDGGGVMLVGIDVSPALATAAIGTTVGFTATGRFSDGTTRDLTALATWSSSDSRIATVSGGVAKAQVAGVAAIQASAMGQQGTARLTVSTAALVSITVEPAGATLPRGVRLQMRATGVLSDGAKQDLTTQVAWASSNTGVASISPVGLASAGVAGNTTISATFGSVTGRTSLDVTGATLVSIEVTPVNPITHVPSTVPFVATGIFSDGTTGDVTGSAQWRSSNTGVMSVANDGLGTALSAGAVTITASIGSASGSTMVTVSPARLTGISVTPASASIPRGTTQAFRATGSYSDGTTSDITTSVAWSSSSPAIASLSNAAGNQGLATGLEVGGVQVLASLSGITGGARLSVTSATLTSLAVTPADATIAIGRNVRLTATATFSDGSRQDVTDAAAWTSDAAAIAAVSNAPGSAGTVTGIAAGTTRVVASWGGKTAEAKITVSTAVLDKITVKPEVGTVTVGLRIPFTATGSYSDGTTLDLTNDVTWSTDNRSVAIVSNAIGSRGQTTGVGAGMTIVRAKLGTVEGTATVTVNSPEYTSLAVEPINPSRRVGESLSFLAIAIYGNGTARNVTSMAMWTAPMSPVATVTATGQATCNATGTLTIIATYMGKTDSTVLTCTTVTLNSLQVTPFTTTILVGQRVFLNANAIYSDGSVRNVNFDPGVTWTSSNARVADVMRGSVIGVTDGMATITATYMGFSASSLVTVHAATLSSIAVTPANASIRVGQTLQYTAMAVFSDGSQRDITSTAIWTSSNPMAADVSNLFPRGQAKGIAAGSTNIIASYMGFTGQTGLMVRSATLTRIGVSPANAGLVPGQAQPYVATAFYEDGSSEVVTNLTIWSSSNTMVANISNGGAQPRGVALAMAPGTTMITGSYMGFMDTVTLNVSMSKISALSVSPLSSTLYIGQSLQYQAVAVYEDGSSQVVTMQATWTSSAPTTAGVSRTGLVSALSGGKVTISASYSGLTANASLTVTAARLKLVRVTPAMASMTVGQVQQYQAVAEYEDGALQDVTFLSVWASTKPSVADVSNAVINRGQVTALSAGMANIAATYMGTVGATPLTVP